MNDFYLIEIDGYDPVKGGTNTLYLSTGKGYTTKPFDTPANTYYQPLVINPGRYHRDLFSQGTTGGNSEPMYGDIEFANPGGKLDYLLAWGLDGHGWRIKTKSGVTIFTGISEQLSDGWKTFSLRIRDNHADLKVPFKKNRYLGNNTNGGGVEGETGLLNALKPFVLGGTALMSPILVNASKQIYHLHDTSVITGFFVQTVKVFDMGVPLTEGPPYTSQADMEANAPAPGQFRHWYAGGMVRLGSSPIGKLSATVDNPQTLQILMHFCLQVAGKESADAISLSAPFDKTGIGVLVADNENIDSILDRLCAPFQLWWAFDRNGMFRAGSMDPTYWGDPVITLDNSNILSVKILATNDSNRGVPTTSFNFCWDKNNAVHNDSDVAASVKYNNLPTVASQVFTRAHNSVPLNFDIYPAGKHLLAATQQTLEYERIGDDNLFAVWTAIENVQATERQLFEITIKRQFIAVMVALLDLGVIVRVYITNAAGAPRLGLGVGGKKMIITSIEPDLGTNSLTLNVWG